MSVCVGISHSNFYPLDLHQEGILVQATMLLSQFMHLHKRVKKKKKKDETESVPCKYLKKINKFLKLRFLDVFSQHVLFESVFVASLQSPLVSLKVSTTKEHIKHGYSQLSLILSAS